MGLAEDAAAAGGAATITVVIRTYDRKDLLRRALRSLAGQRCEVVVAADRRCGYVDEICGEFPSVRTVVCDEGMAAAWNRGVEAARTEWVKIFDDDDVMMPDGIAVLERCAAEMPEARDSLCVSLNPIQREGSDTVEWPPHPDPGRVNGMDPAERKVGIAMRTVPYGQYLARRELLLSLPARTGTNEDLDIALRSGGRVCLIPACQTYHVHGQQSTRKQDSVSRRLGVANKRLGICLSHIPRRVLLRHALGWNGTRMGKAYILLALLFVRPFFR